MRGRGQPIKHPEGPATARLEMRVPEPIKAKIKRNGGTNWVIHLVREAKEKEHGGSEVRQEREQPEESARDAAPLV